MKLVRNHERNCGIDWRNCMLIYCSMNGECKKYGLDIFGAVLVVEQMILFWDFGKNEVLNVLVKIDFLTNFDEP